jgi:tetratricopeptide (TPR) repeat protein
LARLPSRWSHASIAAGILVAALSAADGLAVPPENDAWHERRAEHFTFLGDGSEKSTLATAVYFETVRAAFGVLVPGIALRTAPMDVYVFRDAPALVPYSLLHAGMDTKRPTGYYRSAEYVKLCAVMADQAHESLEAALRAYLGDVAQTTFPTAPPWVQTGLAQIYSGMVVKEVAFEIGRPIPPYILLLRKQRPIPFAELFAMARPMTPGEVVGAPSVFDAESWALMHYLLIGDEELRPKTIRFLKSLSDGAPARAAFDEAFGASAAGRMDVALQAYAAKDALAYYTLPASAIHPPPPGNPSPLPRRDTLYRLGWLLANIDEANAPQAESHFRASLAIDPAYGPSLAGLGWIRSRAKKYDEATPFFEQALASGADDPLTLTLAGRNLLAAYGATRGTFDAPKTLPDGVARARDLLERATSACPKCAESYAALGATYLYDPGDPAPGIVAIETALTLAPPRRPPACARSSNPRSPASSPSLSRTAKSRASTKPSSSRTRATGKGPGRSATRFSRNPSTASCARASKTCKRERKPPLSPGRSRTVLRGGRRATRVTPESVLFAPFPLAARLRS